MIGELGIGVVYFPNAETFIRSNSDLLNYLEIEPQTLWFKRFGLDSYDYNRETADWLLETKLPVVFHGVGFPVGSYRPPDAEQWPCLTAMMEVLKPRWMSEHLSFNSFTYQQQQINTNFLLPPLQTPESIDVIVKSINAFQKELSIPFAFETGTNYLKPKQCELPDGHFVATIAEKADCSILLDLHNIWANQLNGRQSVEEYIAQLPLERVIEVHLASGFWYRNYYLDAHSGALPADLFAIAANVIVKLPNLKAITFEVLPDYLQFVSNEALRKSMEQMAYLWDVRGKDHKSHKPLLPSTPADPLSATQAPLPEEWENTLGARVLRLPAETNAAAVLLENDPGITVMQDLVDEFRASAIVSALKFSCRYIMMVLGDEYLKDLFKTFWLTHPPRLFAVEAGIEFARFLLQEPPPQLKAIPYFEPLLQYEYHSLLAIYENKNHCIETTVHPLEIVHHVARNTLPPADLPVGSYLIDIQCQNETVDTSKLQAVFHS